jgi:ABC-type transport system involved in cytochrome c biogenesis permease subunit
MFNSIQAIFIGAVFFYFLDSIWEIGAIFRLEKFSKRLINFFILSGLGLHGAFLIILSVKSKNLPINTLFESSVFFLFLIVLIAVITKYLYKLPSLTPFVLPVITVVSIASIALIRNDLILSNDLAKFWQIVHIIPIFLGYAAFMVSFILSIMYLTQERQLKTKNFGLLFNSLPSLETLDALMWKTITFGFPLLTIGLVTGTIWAKTSNILGELWYLDSKVLLGAFTWLVYAALLHLRLGASFHGTKVACVTIACFVIVLLTFIGPFLIGSRHAYVKSSIELEQKIPPDDVGMAKMEF